MAKQNFGTGDFDHISQRATKALALLETLRAAMRDDEYPMAAAGHVLDEVLGELSEILDAAHEARETREAQAVAS